MTETFEVYRRHARLRDEFIRNGPYKEFSEQFDRLLQRRRAADSLGLKEEAKGIAVIGASGSGKTRLIQRVMAQHPDLVEPVPGDEFIEFTSSIVPADSTVKNLGSNLLGTLGYASVRNSGTSGDIWRQLRSMLKKRRTRFIHLDEAQHLFSSQNKSVRESVVDTLKTLLNNEIWPVGLILSGTPKMVEMLNADPQLGRRMNVVKIPPISWASDAKNVEAILRKYTEKAELELSAEIDLQDFLPRLIHACTNEFGRTVDMILHALEEAMLSGSAYLEQGHFSTVFGRKSGCIPALNVFLASDYLSIDASKVLWARLSGIEGWGE